MTDARAGQDIRPSPDALLEAARREEGLHGRLRIFVGAAPGVGKTYAMLQAAQAKKADGVDVIIGVVETHGRKETEALVEGLTVFPRRRIEYKGQWLDDMDLDGLIARHPRLAIVDELAHTNAPGSRHPKRYQDVLELLDNGIDVYTAVNIQHVESLNDVVAQITHVRVRETVPDSIFARADAVELIDLTPEDLIQRLKEGKVYVPDQATRALEQFFSPANLTALRELALRRTAERVDEQLLTQMQARAIPGPWAGERVLVCVSEDPRSAGLVRYAKRLADRLHATWTAVYVESRRSAQLSEDQRDRIADAMRLAESLGGEPVTLPDTGRPIAEDLIAHSQANNIAHIIVGKSTRSFWFELLHGSVVHQLISKSGNISVHVIAGKETEAGPAPRLVAAIEPQFRWQPYVAALLAVAVALAAGLAGQPWLGGGSANLVFLTAVVGVAARYGLGPSLFASVVASLAFNFFLLPPLYTFTIADPNNVAAFFFFIVMAVVVSNVAARGRAQAVAATARARATDQLYAFSKKLAGIGTLDDVLWTMAFQIASMLKVRVVLLLPGAQGLEVKGAYPPEDFLEESDLAAAKWSFESNRAAGRGADTLPGARRLFLPMSTGRGTIGVIGIDSDRQGAIFTPDQRRLLDALSDQGTIAIERVNLVADMQSVRQTVETEKLRSALLTSISHDLKTPLASVLGAASALRGLGDDLSSVERAELLQTIIDESERLNRFIANLLDMTRLESGAVVPNKALQDVNEVVGSALRRADKILAGHKVVLELGKDLPMLDLDAVLAEQALFNLLDNAAKYAPLGSTITIRTDRYGPSELLQVIDEGDGIPAGDTERIFDKFYRARKSDQVRAGTGLGLAISRGFIEAMDGTITASNRIDRSGAVFTITLPVPYAAKPMDTAA